MLAKRTKWVFWFEMVKLDTFTVLLRKKAVLTGTYRIVDRTYIVIDLKLST